MYLEPKVSIYSISTIPISQVSQHAQPIFKGHYNDVVVGSQVASIIKKGSGIALLKRKEKKQKRYIEAHKSSFLTYEWAPPWRNTITGKFVDIAWKEERIRNRRQKGRHKHKQWNKSGRGLCATFQFILCPLPFSWNCSKKKKLSVLLTLASFGAYTLIKRQSSS